MIKHNKGILLLQLRPGHKMQSACVIYSHNAPGAWSVMLSRRVKLTCPMVSPTLEQCNLLPRMRHRLQPLSVGPINGGKLIGSNSKLWSFANKARRDIHSLRQRKLSCNYDTGIDCACGSAGDKTHTWLICHALMISSVLRV